LPGGLATAIPLIIVGLIVVGFVIAKYGGKGD